MRVLRAAAVIALLAGPAYAQEKIPQYGEIDKPDKTQTQIDADKAAERAYKNSLGNIPDKGPSDPWGAVRSDNAPKPAAKAPTKSAAKTAPAKPQTKTGSTAN
jgi:hypothetical protein